jgi:hypothetical protein
MLAAGLDFTRSAGHSVGKGFWIGELQAGQGTTGMRIAAPVDSHDEEFWIWKVLSHGAREIAIYAWYPMSSGYESNGYGLIDLDGTLTSGRVPPVMWHVRSAKAAGICWLPNPPPPKWPSCTIAYRTWSADRCPRFPGSAVLPATP